MQNQMQSSSMTRSMKRRILLCMTVAILATAVPAQAGTTLLVNSKTISTNVRIIGGQAYVPLADVARAFHGTMVQRAGGYEIVSGSGGGASPVGGANQVQGLNGRVGQVLFTGKWRFEVVSVTRADEYTTRYQSTQETIKPSSDNQELVIVNCQIRNARKTTIDPLISAIHPHNTALTNDQGQSYPPLAFDKRGATSDSNDFGATMLPGSAANVAAIFSVPKQANLKDLVFSLQSLQDGLEVSADVRVSMAQ